MEELPRVPFGMGPLGSRIQIDRLMPLGPVPVPRANARPSLASHAALRMFEECQKGERKTLRFPLFSIKIGVRFAHQFSLESAVGEAACGLRLRRISARY